MRADIYRFAGDVNVPELFISPLADRGIGTTTGKYACDYGTLGAFRRALAPEMTESDEISFTDLEAVRTPDMDTLKDRFEDATGGVHPGHPTVKYRDVAPEAKAEELLDISMDTAAAQLERFYRLTKLQPKVLPSTQTRSSEQRKATWDGDSHKFYARVRLPYKRALMTNLLHELGHCSMGLVGFARDTTTTVSDLQWSIKTDWMISSTGLVYEAEGEWKGSILEEAVAEGLGMLVNRKLGLVKTRHNDEVQKVPDIVAPYLKGPGYPGSAPAAVALELIARELGIPSDRYFQMFVDYANKGVHNTDARQEVAETIYRGTRGRLTMSQVEELPYPITPEASLAFLWAVEDSLEVPDHRRYADLFR